MTMEANALSIPWQQLIANINGRDLFGQPGVRDPESPCNEFAPVEGIDWLGLRLTAPGDGDCQTDGHYLCLGCAHLDFEGSRFADEP